MPAWYAPSALPPDSTSAIRSKRAKLLSDRARAKLRSLPHSHRMIAIIRGRGRASSGETRDPSFLLRGRDGGDGSQEDGDRPAVLLAEPRCAFDDLGHRTADEVEIRRVAVGQQADDVVTAPITDAGFAVGGDVRNLLAVRTLRRAGEKARRIGCAERIARGVAIAAAA